MTLLERDREKIEEGKEIGKAELLLKLLSKKFSTLPKEYEEKIKEQSEEVLEKIAVDIFDISDIEELNRYFK